MDWLDGRSVDGKTIRNSAVPGGVDVKLFSALTHREQVVIAQIAVPEHTTEVTCVPASLDPVTAAGPAWCRRVFLALLQEVDQLPLPLSAL